MADLRPARRRRGCRLRLIEVGDTVLLDVIRIRVRVRVRAGDFFERKVADLGFDLEGEGGV